jgi:hypothetical protein
VKARENPFRSECVDALAYRAPGFGWDDLETRLAAARGRGAIVGPEGHGKTTLLLEWMERRRRVGDDVVFVKLEAGQRRLAQHQQAAVDTYGSVYVDSAEQLGWLGWRELLHLTVAARALVITTHRRGRLPTVFLCRTSPELLGELVRQLTGEPRDCSALWRRHRGDIRLALRELYDAASSALSRDSSKRGGCNTFRKGGPNP